MSDKITVFSHESLHLHSRERPWGGRVLGLCLQFPLRLGLALPLAPAQRGGGLHGCCLEARLESLGLLGMLREALGLL